MNYSNPAWETMTNPKPRASQAPLVSYIIARSFSWLASSAFMLALGMWVKDETDSNTLAGITIASTVAPRVLGIFLGSIVDRVPRKIGLVGANLASAAVALALLGIHGSSSIIFVWIVGFLYGLLGVITNTSAAGALQVIAPPERIPAAMSAMQATNGVIQLFGPIAGAAIYALSGIHALAAGTAAIFLLATLAAAVIRIPGSAPPRNRGMWEGLRHIRRSPALFSGLTALVIVQSAIGFIDGALYALIDAIRQEPSFAGIIFGAQGAGAVIGGGISFLFIRKLGMAWSMFAGLVASAACLVGICLVVPFWLPVLVLIFLAGLLTSVVFTSFGTLVQLESPQEVIGRVHAAVNAAQSTPALASLLLGSLLIAVVDFRVLYSATALAALAGAFAIFVAMRRDKLASTEEETARSRTAT